MSTAIAQHVLVTGGAGYIGSVLVRHLLATGLRVRVLDACVYGDSSIRGCYGHPAFSMVRGDVCQSHVVNRALADIDAVVHLAAIVGDRACTIDPQSSETINVAGTRTLLHECERHAVQRLVFASTCSVYGCQTALVDERSAVQPHSLYADTKATAEQLILAAHSSQLATTVLRLATVYGVSPRPRFDLVVNLLTAKAVCAQSITICGGQQWRPFIHVADVALAIERVLRAPVDHVGALVFNVGGDDQNYTLDAVGALICRMFPHTRCERQAASVDERSYKVGFSRIRQTLDFQPCRTLDGGIHEVATAIRSHAISAYSAPIYHNADWLLKQRAP